MVLGSDARFTDKSVLIQTFDHTFKVNTDNRHLTDIAIKLKIFTDVDIHQYGDSETILFSI